MANLRKRPAAWAGGRGAGDRAGRPYQPRTYINSRALSTTDMGAALRSALNDCDPEDRAELAAWGVRILLLAVAHENGFEAAAGTAYEAADVLAGALA